MTKEEMNEQIASFHRRGDTWQLNARRALQANDPEASEAFQAKANECYEKAANLRLTEMGIKV